MNADRAASVDIESARGKQICIDDRIEVAVVRDVVDVAVDVGVFQRVAIGRKRMKSFSEFMARSRQWNLQSTGQGQVRRRHVRGHSAAGSRQR